MPTLSHAEAREVYDRLGAGQDREAFYEDPAFEELVGRGGFGTARAVVELGCGTGRFAARLLERHLPGEATYRGFDLSATMVRLASGRLERFGARAEVSRTSGDVRLPLPPASADRYLSTYVLDLLSEDDAARALADAARLLRPGGRLCLAGITPGESLPSRIVMGLWGWVAERRPRRLGGCRPQRIAPLLAEGPWDGVTRTLVTARGVASEVVVAERR